MLPPGEGFLLSLARAVLRKPAVLIIEEPAEELSDDIKNLLDDTYQRLIKPDRTVIFLPSRLATLRRADQVVLLHQGKVAVIGPQAKLVKESGLYRHWEYIKFNEFRHEFDPSSQA